ncbi:MAG: hypothetical protein ACTHV2_05775 [Brachybacterium sp.]|uniref:hypothetical protein n=1 Tax=Brachybacterium sp. TaxID=1891286 RepID=UPI0026531D08|nr:hypothetical protein [Brachybacterium sp.]MDN6328456.1 hypothetical protein [Brachybacterium sp.]MDN6400389.1 hypothetical protein [Brachybacterium sp.]
MPPPSLLSHAADLALSVGIGMIPLHRLPRPVQTGYVVLPGAFTSAILLLAQQRTAPRSAVIEREGGGSDEPSRGPRRPTARECALSLAGGGAVAGIGAASISLDHAFENLLRRRGVPAPRLTMGLTYGALLQAAGVLAHRAPAHAGERHGGKGPEQSPDESA